MHFDFSCARIPAIEFGCGRIRKLPRLVRTLGSTALLVTGSRSYKASGHWDEFTAALDREGVARLHTTISGEPAPQIIDAAVAEFRHSNIEVVVAWGGGSVVDAGKAISAMLRHPEPVATYLEGVGTQDPTGARTRFIAVPTTSGTGSEATKNAVLSQVGPGGFKKSLRHDNFVPDAAVVDPDLMVSCPRAVTAACGMDAFTQLLESYVSQNASPMTDALAFAGMEAARDTLVPACTDAAQDPHARAGMAFAALMSGITLASAGLGVVHGIAGPMGGLFPIPHGVACGTLLAPATAATIKKLQQKHGSEHPALHKYAAVGAMLRRRESRNPPAGCAMLLEVLREWADALALPRLAQYGIAESDLDALAAASDSKANPEPLSTREIRDLLMQRL